MGFRSINQTSCQVNVQSINELSPERSTCQTNVQPINRIIKDHCGQNRGENEKKIRSNLITLRNTRFRENKKDKKTQQVSVIIGKNENVGKG